MNKNHFRLVYSRLRGMLVAVAETARGTGKADSGETTSPRSAGRISLFSMRHAVFAALMLFGVAPSLVNAQVAAAGAHAPSVAQTANGLQQVNINAPSGAGVSQNTYSQFDVPKAGVILNNSPVIVQTQQAGYINGNPNFAAGQSAKIILNRVNSSSPSQLRGYIEVAGSKAEVVLANGSGIVVNGGGFINTTRGILTTGSPTLDANGNLSGFAVTGGQITVQGAGLNATNVDQVDLIARAVQANAAIYANNLNVVTGANQVDHDTLAATPIAGNGPPPSVSIDVSQLGGMYANRITLVGTENGVGVSNAGVIAAQAGDLTLTTQGKLILTGNTSASGNLAVSAAAGVDNSGTTYAQQFVSVITPGSLTNSGTLAAQQGLTVNAGSFASTGTLGAGINADGSVGQGGDLNVVAGNTLSATGQNLAGGNATLQGNSVTLTGSETAANGALNVAAAQILDTSAATLDATQLSLSATNLTNHGGTLTQTGSGPTGIAVSGTFDNTNGSLTTNGAGLTLAPAALINNGGKIADSGTGALSIATGSLSNNGGSITTNGALDVQAGALSNRGGTLAAQSHAAFKVASLDNSGGGYIGARDVSITDAGTLDNSGGTVQANDLLNVSAQTLSNDGGAIANGGTASTTVSASGALNNTGGGLIGGNGNVSVSGGSINNAGGTVTASGATTVQSGSTLDNSAGLIQGNANVSATASGAISNTGGQIEADGAAATLAVSGASVDNTNGRIANIGAGATTVNAASITNSNAGGASGAGMIGGNGDVTLTSQGLSNTLGAQVVSGHDLTLNVAQSVNNSGGMLSGANNLSLDQASAAVVNQNGSVHANGTVDLNVASLDNSSGRIGNDAGSGGTTGITAGTLTNQNGAIGSDQNLSVTTNQLNGDGQILAGRDGTVTINGSYTNDAANRIQANHDLTFTTTGTFTNQGTLGAVNALTVTAANVDNQAGADLNSASTTINAANAITNEGRIEGDTVATKSASLTNTATIIGNTVTLSGTQYIANTGAAAVMAAAALLNLYSPGDISNTGGANMFSVGDINIAADATRDTNGLLADRSNSVTNAQSTIQAQGNLEVATQTLTNSRPAPTIETVTTDVSSLDQTKRSKYMACATGNSDKGYCTQAMWDNGYIAPINVSYSASQIVSETSGPNATDNVLVVNVGGQPQTIWYNSITNNGDGTITVNYWDDYNPNINYLPSTEYTTRSDGHNGYQRVEISRTTTTTTQQDQVTSAASEAQLLAGGNMTLANVGTINNVYSAIAAGGSIQIGSAPQTGSVASGNYGGTTVNNVGQTLYQHQTQDIVSTYAWNETTTQDVDQVVEPSIVLAPVAIGGTGGTITAGNAIQINATDINNTNVAAVNSATGATGGTLGANQALTGQQVNAPQTVASSIGALNITLPTSGLYALQTAPGASYLIATDPRLTSYTSFISSDYMLQQLGLNPQTVEKRLDDGMYEEQLVRNQITQLTGRVYLQGYTNNEAEYQALMMSGVNAAREFNLEPGMALTAAQMDALTSDIVWLVNQTVTLPDGTTQQVLAPVVYLAQTHPNDLQPSGALISADDVEIHATGSATNSGVIKGGTQTVVSATDILNRGGSISSSGTDGTTVVSATNDVVNASGQITGNRVAVLAGRDIVNTTLVDTAGVSNAAGDSKVGQTLLGTQGTIASTGDMVVAAGNDLTVHGANITAGGNSQVTAGHDITVDAVQSTTSQSVTQNDQHHWEANTTVSETSAIAAGGSLAMQSGNDMTFKGAQVSAGGDLAVVTGGNLTATNVTNTAQYDNTATDSKTRQEVDHTYDEQAVGTSFTAGGNASLAAISSDAGKGNVTLTGSSLTAGVTNGVDNGTGTATIAASGNMTINEAREEHDNYQDVESKRGSFVHSSMTDTSLSTQANVGVASAVSGDTVQIGAGKDLMIKGATVVGTSDVNLAALGNVTITTSQDTQNTSSYYQKHESGFGTSGGIGISVGSKTQTDTTRTSQVTNTGSTIGSLNGNLNVSAGNDLHVTGSDLIAAKNVTGTGANVTIDAATDTAHQDNTQTVKQSGFTLAVKAPVLDALQNTVQQSKAAGQSQDSRAAALHGMAAASGAVDAAGLAGSLANGQMPSAKIEISYGSSSSTSTFMEDSTTQKGSSVTAGGTAAFVATGGGNNAGTPGSGNVTIAGSNVNANDVLLAAQNQVNLLNTTDTDSTHSTNESKSASVGVSYGTQGWSVDASASKASGNGNSDAAMQNNTHVTAANSATIISGGDTNIIGSNVSGKQVTADVGGNLNIASVQDTMTSDAHQESSGGGFSISQGGASGSLSSQHGDASGSHAGVNEQAGIQAGTGGFNIAVNGNTDLKGAVIASDADATKNSLTTGTLTYSDIQNSSSYDANSSGFSAGTSFGDGGNNYSTHGQTSGSNTGGAAPMLGQHDSGSDSATTRSGVSAATINVTDSANQTQDIAVLNRDTSNTNGTVAKTPDVNNLLGNQADMMSAASAAGEAVARRIGDYADSKMKEAAANGDQAGVDAWKEGGADRAMMQAAGAALVAGIGGGNVVGAAAGAGVASLASGKLNELSGAIASSNPTGDSDINQALGNIVANAIATGAGAAVGGNAGAFSGYNVDLYNRQLHPEEKTLAKQLADKSGGKYTEAQVEDQMRQMGVSVNGQIESGAAATLIGQAPTDMGAQWIGSPSTSDGQTVLTQRLAPADPQLQAYILANYNSASPGGIPSQFTYALPSGNSGSSGVTGPFTQFNSADANFVRNTTADAASMVSTNAGRFGSATAAGAEIPSPYSPALGAAAFAATIAGISADAIAQIAKPNIGQYTYGGVLSLGAQVASDRIPLASPAINETVNALNNSPYSANIVNWLNNQWDSISKQNGK
ncbi:hemagglutinin repeat-containing protein [Paraburkholderia sp. BL10I2N1]|uniref:two-partner secretion domain-containing protein n=1 Tax=Paraburkholderia sp. BL10I2N1 TaxID=1938796 RepID=UPI00105EF3E1|nr:hemagglutinin repeat-containing protein [Paraburkholderia sp. BL10I2N1]TDN69873.1 filamentous hemagglutinin [Paraburkholderia sp. BL10I2N1]